MKYCTIYLLQICVEKTELKDIYFDIISWKGSEFEQNCHNLVNSQVGSREGGVKCNLSFFIEYAVL